MCSRCREIEREREEAYAEPAPSSWQYRLSEQVDLNLQARKTDRTSNNNSPKENPEVSSSRIYDAADRKVREELDKRETERIAAEKMALVDAYGEDSFVEGTVIRFDKRYSKSGTAYTFVAVKFNDESDTWRTSSVYDGESNRTWGQLVELLVSGPFPTASIDVMTVERTHPAAAAPKTDAES